ncbi:MAG: hypothetical protein ACUZ8H_01610 [Candidatus Anammoxibacter sp.]
MAKILKLRRLIPIDKADRLKTKFLDDSCWNILIKEDTDGFDLYGNMLFRYRKNAIPLVILKSGVDAFKGSIELTESRGAASGASFKRIRADGSIANTTVGNKVYSGNVGYMDSSAMVRYCRKTAFARDHFEKFEAGIPFVEYVDKLYEELCPKHYAKQISISRGTNVNYRIKDTSFTTVTVNKNFRTACHKDAGDYQEGFGNLVVYREGHYDGGYFCLPEFGVALDMQNEDVLFVDVHRWHGNTEFINKSWDFLRISFVLYYREYMIKCKGPTEELQRVKMDQGGYLKL